MTPADVERARRCAVRYRELGLSPLPSRMDKKGPMLPTYAEYYDPGNPMPADLYAPENWRTTNIQLITGAKVASPTKIVVVDCDGEEAHELWQRILMDRKYGLGSCWRCRTGSGGYHYYFRLPTGIDSCPSGLLWGLWDTYGEDGKGKWAKHKELRILADNNLVIAPPSIHVETGRRYEFTTAWGPKEWPGLEHEAPDWLLAMPRLERPTFGTPAPRPARPAAPFIKPPGLRYSREEVLDALGDNKMQVARDWGVVFDTFAPNPAGWCRCYVPWRETPGESKPSGSFHYQDGTLQDRKDESSMSLFDLGVALGHYARWQDCRDDLGARFIGRKDQYRQASRVWDGGRTGPPKVYRHTWDGR